MAGLCLFSILRLCLNYLVLFVILILGNIWLFISIPPFNPCGFKDPCYIFAVQPIKIGCKANRVNMGLKFKQFNSTRLLVDLSMHILMSYFCGTKVQMTTALLWYRNCCPSHTLMQAYPLCRGLTFLSTIQCVLLSTPTLSCDDQNPFRIYFWAFSVTNPNSLASLDRNMSQFKSIKWHAIFISKWSLPMRSATQPNSCTVLHCCRWWLLIQCSLTLAVSNHPPPPHIRNQALHHQ